MSSHLSSMLAPTWLRFKAPGAFWGLLGGSWRFLRPKKRTAWKCLFFQWISSFFEGPRGFLGASCGPPGASWRRLGAVLRPSWAVLEAKRNQDSTKMSQEPPKSGKPREFPSGLKPKNPRTPLTPPESEARWRVRRGPSLGFLRISLGYSYLYP